MTDIATRVKEIVAKHVGHRFTPLDEPAMTAALLNDEDGLLHVDLAANIEAEFNIAIDDITVAEWDSVAGIVATVEGLVK